MNDTRVVGIILAGGRSSRFEGGRKDQAPLFGRALIDHVISRAAPQVSVLAISRSADHVDGNDAFPVLYDEFADMGPIAGVYAGLRWAAMLSPRVRYLATFACDTPLIPDDLVERLTAAAAATNAPAAIAASGEKAHPTSAIWSPSLVALAKARLAEGKLSLFGLAEAAGAARADFGVEAISAFANVNTAADLDALAPAVRRPGV